MQSGRPAYGPAHFRATAVLLVAVVALIAAGAGAAIGVAVGRDQKTSSTTSTTVQTASVESSGASGTQTALEAVAASVSPAVVLVTEQSGDLLGTGSGIVLDAAKGYILTNNHVVSAYATAAAGSGATLTVTTMAGKTAKATVVGRDATADIAVIQVSLPGLTQARMGDSSKVVVGETVVAIGAPLGLQGTVTSGIVSALHRPVSTEDNTNGSSAATQATIDAIQTDAAINPGNSGGPLVDLSGAVVGVNSAIATVSAESDGEGQDSESGSIGVGFAIPINEALYTADQIEKTGYAVHAVLGVGLQDDQDAVPTTSGAVVASVVAGGPAAKAGFKVGDVITAVDGQPIPDADAAVTAIRADHKPGDVVHVTVRRGGQTLSITVTLGASAPS